MFLRVCECSNDFCKRRFLQVQNAKTAPFSVGIFVDLRSGRENIAPMKRRYISFVAAVLLCGCACVETPEPAEFTVASFNVGFCKDPSDVRRWDARKNLIMPLVEFHGFDIVGMQEPMGFQVDYLAAQSDKYAVAGLTLCQLIENKLIVRIAAVRTDFAMTTIKITRIAELLKHKRFVSLFCHTHVHVYVFLCPQISVRQILEESIFSYPLPVARPNMDSVIIHIKVVVNTFAQVCIAFAAIKPFTTGRNQMIRIDTFD